MATFNDDLVDQVKTGLCITTNTARATAALGGRIAGSLGYRGGQNTAEDASQFWGNASGIFCNRQRPDTADQISPPFTGGQCPDERYRVVANGFTWIDADGNTQVNPGSGTIRIGQGPLSLVKDRNNQRWRIESAGEGFLFSADVSSEGPAATIISINPSISTQSGDPDDCGDPPALPPDYNREQNTYNTNVNYTDENGDPQSEPVDIVYGPTTINENGDFIVPVTVEFGDGSFSFGDVNVSVGDITIGGGGNSDGDGIQPEPRELEEGEEPDDGTSIVGVRVTSTVVSLKAANLTELFSDDGGENLFVPRLGGVLFTLEGDSGPAETVFREFKTLDSVITSPKPAKSVRLFTRQGVSSVTRLLVVPNASLCCRN
jgi:hypothetical protein